MRTYHVWGIRRSGNHAIIGWLLKHVGAPYVHFNDIQDVRNPLTPSGVVVSGAPAWRYKRGLLRKARQFFRSRSHGIFAGSDPTVDYRKLAALPGLACRVFSYEDKPVTSARPGVLVLRDPFNLFASLLKAGYFTRPLEELPVIYASHAEAFLCQKETGIVGVNFNEWFQSAGYRISIASRLGFETDGEPYDEVPANGGGSSFSGRTHRGQASRMDVLGRWRDSADRADFRRFINEPRVRNAAEAIFPDLADEVYGTLRPAARRSCSGESPDLSAAAASASFASTSTRNHSDCRTL